MKRRMVVIALVLVMMLTMQATASAKVTRTPFVSVSIPMGIQDPGEWSFPGDNMHFRGRVELFYTESEDDRVTGEHTLIVNGNWDADGHGPVWGTYNLDADAYDGAWKGTFTGSFDEDGISLKIIGRGFGELDGLRIEGTVLNGVTEGLIIDLPKG